MAISPRYALRETGQNLWRNVLLSAATVITIGVSLWLFGGFLGLHHFYLRRYRQALVWWCLPGQY